MDAFQDARLVLELGISAGRRRRLRHPKKHGQGTPASPCACAFGRGSDGNGGLRRRSLAVRPFYLNRERLARRRINTSKDLAEASRSDPRLPFIPAVCTRPMREEQSDVPRRSLNTMAPTTGPSKFMAHTNPQTMARRNAARAGCPGARPRQAVVSNASLHAPISFGTGGGRSAGAAGGLLSIGAPQRKTRAEIGQGDEGCAGDFGRRVRQTINPSSSNRGRVVPLDSTPLPPEVREVETKLRIDLHFSFARLHDL